MAVTVTLRDRATDKYMRFGDSYVKHNDGGLDVVRGGAKQPYSHAPGDWADVEGNEKSWKRAFSGADRSPVVVEHLRRG